MTESRLMAGAVEIHDLTRTRKSFRGPAQPFGVCPHAHDSGPGARKRASGSVLTDPRTGRPASTRSHLDVPRAVSGVPESEAIEQEIHSARQGLILSWDALPDFICRFVQFDWVVLVGCIDRSDIPRVDKDDLVGLIPKPPELYRDAEIVIELLDTSRWRVYAKDDDLLERIRHEFRDVRPAADDFPA